MVVTAPSLPCMYVYMYAQSTTSITPKVREVYTEIGKALSFLLTIGRHSLPPSLPPHPLCLLPGKMLKTYTAGKLPKAFKILPALANWEEVVYLTRPDEWTPHVSK